MLALASRRATRPSPLGGGGTAAVTAARCRATAARVLGAPGAAAPARRHARRCAAADCEAFARSLELPGAQWLLTPSEDAALPVFGPTFVIPRGGPPASAPPPPAGAAGPLVPSAPRPPPALDVTALHPGAFPVFVLANPHAAIEVTDYEVLDAEDWGAAAPALPPPPARRRPSPPRAGGRGRRRAAGGAGGGAAAPAPAAAVRSGWLGVAAPHRAAGLHVQLLRRPQHQGRKPQRVGHRHRLCAVRRRSPPAPRPCPPPRQLGGRPLGLPRLPPPSAALENKRS